MGLGEYSRAARSDVFARVRAALAEKKGGLGEVTGTVTATGESSFFVQRDEDGLKAVLGDGPARALPRPGDVVKVSGTPTMEGGRVVLLVGDWRKVGEEALPAPRPTDADRLVSVRLEGDDPEDVHALRVVLEGRAVGLTESGFAVQVDDIPVSVFLADIPGFLSDCYETHPKVRIRGVAELVLDQSALFRREPRVLGVKIHVAERGDVELLPDLVYLTNRGDRRMKILVACLIGFLVLVVFVALAVALRQHGRSVRAGALMAERKRMADDLHDTIEQHLVGARMLVQLNRNKEAQDVLLRAKSEIRDIVWGLKNDDMMRLSPTAMLRKLTETELRKGLFRISARLTGLPESMPARQMRDLSLIVREAIGNAVKHGSAKKIAITSDPLPEGGWLLRVGNDGAPFDPAKAPGPAEGHFGLEGMRERARRLGAEVSFASDGPWTVLSVRCAKA